MDNYLMIFIGTMVLIVAAVMSNPYLLTTENEKIIDRIDALAKERQTELNNATQTILANITNVTTTNQELLYQLIEEHDRNTNTTIR